MLTAEEIASHFSRVDAEIAASETHGRPRPGPSRRCEEAGHDEPFRRDSLAALFETGEYAVDTGEIADIVSAAIAAHPAITLRLSTEIVAAEQRGNGAYRITSRAGEENRTGDYAAALNALWDDRLRIDAMLGIAPARPSLARYKATLNTRTAPKVAVASLPSLTLVSGAYGDMVNYGNGGFYLSWYPACKLGQADGSDPRTLTEAAKGLSCDALLAETIEGLGHYVKGIDTLTESGFVAGGAMVMAQGEADIDDPESGLHRRYAIGPELHGRWLSLSTGKYCTAPLFGKRGAGMIAEALA
jgi:hypothetical protein